MPDSQNITIETLSNGMTVIVEEINDIESVAYHLLIPGGIINDDPAFIGSSLIIPELTSRGAGELSAKSLSEAFDACGIRHSESGGHDRFTYRGSLLSSYLDEALRLTALMVLKPRLPAEEIAPIQSLLLQDIAAMMDNPARRVLVEMGLRYYPEPYNRSGYGTEPGIKACNGRQQRLDWERRYGAKGAVLSIAGRCQTKEVLKIVGRHFKEWGGEAESRPPFGPLPPHARHHIPFESAQLQICLACPSAPYGHPEYYAAKVAAGILSGGMCGRLFIEVREKRGLCYSVYARHSATKDYGALMVYAGTTPERAADTCDVLLEALRSLGGTIKADELSRAKANLKAALVIGEESSSARAASNAEDWWLDRRVRSLAEIISEIEAVDCRKVDEHLGAYPLNSFMSVTLGPKEIGA